MDADNKIDQYIGQLQALRGYPVVSRKLKEISENYFDLNKRYIKEKETWADEKYDLELELMIKEERLATLERMIHE